MNDKLQQLYNLYKDNGLITIDFNTFASANGNQRKGLYDLGVEQGLFSETPYETFDTAFSAGQPQEPKLSYQAVPEQPAQTAERQLMSGLESNIPGFEQSMQQKEQIIEEGRAKKKAAAESDLSAKQQLVESTAQQQADASLLASQSAAEAEALSPLLKNDFLKGVYQQLKDEESLPSFVKDQLSAITPELVFLGEGSLKRQSLGVEQLGVEEAVVPKMNYMFGPLGFKFEETGAGDYMIVKAPNKEEMEISLNNRSMEKNRLESEKLKNFIASNSAKIPQIEKYAAQYAGSDARFNSEKQIDVQTKDISIQYDKLNKDAALLSNDIKNVESDLAYLNNAPANERNTPQYLEKKKATEAALLDVNTRRQDIISRNSQIESNKINLDKAVGKYAQMKAQQGTWTGATVSWAGQGVSTALTGLLSTGFDVFTLAGNFIPMPNYTEEMYRKDKKEMLSKVRERIEGAITDPNTSVEWKQLAEESFWGGAYAALVKSAPAMLAPGGWAGRTAAFFGQSTDAVNQEMDKNPAFDNVSTGERLLVSVPIGIANAVLEEVGLRNLLANKGFVNSLVLKGLQKVGVNATETTLSKIIKNDVESMVARGALTLTGAGLAEAETGALQQVGEYAVKDIYNLAKEKQMFDTPDTLKEYVYDVVRSGAQEAVGGFVMGTPSAAAAAYRKQGFKGMSDEQFETFEAIANDEKMQSSFIATLKTKVAAGDMTMSDAKEELNDYRNSVGLYRSIPTDLNTEAKKEAMNLVREKQVIEESIKDKDEALVKKQKDRIAEINVQLNTLSTNAVQEQTTSEVPIQSEAGVSEEMERGEPTAEPQVTTEEGKEEEVVPAEVTTLTPEEQSRKETLESWLSVREEEEKRGFNDFFMGGFPTEENPNRKPTRITFDEAQAELDALNAKITPTAEVTATEEVTPEAVVSDIDTELKTINESIGRVKQDFNQEEDDMTLYELGNKVTEAKRTLSKAEDTDAAVNELKKAEKEKSDFEESLAKRKDFNDVDNLIADEIENSKKDRYEYKDLFEQDPRLASLQSAKDMIEFAKENPDVEINVAKYENDIKLIEEDIAKFPVKTAEVTPTAKAAPAPKKRGRKKSAPAPVVEAAPVAEVTPTEEEVRIAKRKEYEEKIAVNEPKVIEHNKQAKENKGENINIKDFKRTKKRGQDLKIGDVYVRKIYGTNYVFKVLSKLTKNTGQFYWMKVEVLHIGNDYVRQELDPAGDIREVGRKVGDTAVDSFKNMSSGTGKFNFGEVTVLENFEAAPEAKTEVAPAPAPVVEAAPAPKAEPAPTPTPAPAKTAKEIKAEKELDDEIKSLEREIDVSIGKIEDLENDIVTEKEDKKEGTARFKEQIAEIKQKISDRKKSGIPKETIKVLVKELEIELDELEGKLFQFREDQDDYVESYKEEIAQEKADMKKAQKRLDKLMAKKEQATQPAAAPKKPGVLSMAEIKKRFPLAAEFIDLLDIKVEQITKATALDVLVSAYGYLPRTKEAAEKTLLQIEQIEDLVEALGQNIKKVSKEEFKKQIAESGDFTKAQLKIFNALVDSLQTELMPEYISIEEATQYNAPSENFYITSLNKIISKEPEAFIHEVGHFGFFKILSKEDRLKFLQYMIESSYITGKPSLASRMAITSDDLVGVSPSGQETRVRSNAADDFSEYFAEQFRQWYMSERLFPKDIDTIFGKVAQFFNLFIEKLKSGKYVDKNLSEYFNKISAKIEKDQKKNEKIQDALGIEETMMNELQDLEDFFGIDPAISPMSMRYDTPLQKMALMYNMTESGFFPRNASEPHINKDFFQFGLKAKRASSGSYYLVNINTGKMVKPLQRPKGGIPPQVSRMSVTISPEVVNQTAKDLSKQKTIDDETVRGYGSWELGEVKYIDSKRVYNDLPDSAATPIEGDYELKIIPISSTNYFFDTDRKGNPVLSREHWEFDNYDNYQTENLDMIKNGYDTKSRKPIILETTKDGLYSVVDGHHRLTIAKELGRKSILALVRKYDGNEAYSNNISYQSASKSYHKAKADGSNPELVNAVDELLSGTIPTQISPMKVTPISVKNMSMEEVITTARDNGFSDDTIKALLMKRGYAAKDIDSALTFNINFASAYTNNNPRTDSPLPKAFRTIDGGINNGIKLFFDVRNKLIDFAATKKTYAEIRAKAIELLEANPIFQGQEDTKQKELIAAFDKTLNITRGKLVSAQIADIRKALKERLVGMKDLKKAQLILRNFIRQSLPAVKVPRVFFNLDGITSPAEGINYFNNLRKQVYDFARTAPDGTVGKKILVKDAEKIKEFTINLLKGTELYKNQSPEVQADMENAIINSQYTKGASHTLDIYSQREVNKLIDIVSQTDSKNLLAQAEKVFDIITDQRAKIKNGLLKEMLILVNKKATSKKTGSGKVRSNGLDAQGQAFYKSIKPIIVAAIKNDTEAMLKIADELSDVEAIQDALDKESAGEELTTLERDLLDKVYAFDTFADILNMELEEVQDLLDGLKGVRSASIVRLNEKRADRAAQREAMTATADEQISRDFKALYNPDGTPKGKNKLDNDKAMIWQSFKELKIWSGVQQWLERYDFFVSPISEYFRKKIAHLGALSNILDKTGTFFTDNLYRPINRMDEVSKTGYLNEADHLDDLANSIKGVTKGYKQIRRLIESAGIVKMNIPGIGIDLRNGDQLARIYALSLNEAQREKLRNMGYTDQKIKQIKEILGPEVTEFVDKLVDYFSNEYYESVNDVYSFVNDVNLGYVENYFPTQTVAQAKNQEKVIDEGLKSGNFTGIFDAESSPALKERTDMSNPIDLAPSFTNVVESHLQSMERYKAFAVGVKRLNDLFKIESVNTLLEQTGLKSIIKNLVNNSVNPNAGVKQVETVLGSAINKFSGYALSFKLMQIPKQAIAISSAYEDYQFLKNRKVPGLDQVMFAFDVAKSLTFARANFNKFYNLSGNFRDRVNKGVEGDVYGLESGGKVFKPLSQKATRLADVKRFIKSSAASPTMAGDIISVYGYMANYNRDIANGMSPEAALEKFNNYNAALQTRRAADKGTLQFSQNELTRAFTMFTSVSMLQINKVAISSKNIMRAIANGKAPSAKDTRAFAINLGVGNALFVAASYVFSLIKGDDEDKEKVRSKMIEALTGLNLLYQVPLIGAGIEEAASMIKGEKFLGGDVTNPYTSVLRKIKKQYEDDNTIIQNFRPAAEFALGMQLDPFIGLYEGATDEFNDDVLYDILGVSPSYRPENKSSLEKMSKSEMKKYDPEEYERLYGPGSKGYDEEQAKKEAKAAEKKARKDAMDDYYNYSSGSGVKRGGSRIGGRGGSRTGGSRTK